MSDHDPRYDDSPLNNPAYNPAHRPILGHPNPTVAKWAPASQLRWFARFWGSDEMPTVYSKEAADYYCSSIQHKGGCCESCMEDIEYDSAYAIDGACCCRALHDESANSDAAESSNADA
jgi:hypothetical protein